MENRENMNANDSLVAELIEGQKNDKKFYKIVIVILLAIILIQGLWHEYQWAQFDTIVVDSGDGGYANFIGNDRDINYGKDSGEKETEKQPESKEN